MRRLHGRRGWPRVRTVQDASTRRFDAPARPIPERTERVDNALHASVSRLVVPRSAVRRRRLTEDVDRARVHASALDLMRVRKPSAAVARKPAISRDTSRRCATGLPAGVPTCRRRRSSRRSWWRSCSRSFTPEPLGVVIRPVREQAGPRQRKHERGSLFDSDKLVSAQSLLYPRVAAGVNEQQRDGRKASPRSHLLRLVWAFGGDRIPGGFMRGSRDDGLRDRRWTGSARGGEATGGTGQRGAATHTLTVTGEGAGRLRFRTESIARGLQHDPEYFERLESPWVGDRLEQVPGVTFARDFGDSDAPRSCGPGGAIGSGVALRRSADPRLGRSTQRAGSSEPFGSRKC